MQNAMKNRLRDLSLYSGEYKEYIIHFKDENGVPININMATPKFAIYNIGSYATPLFEKACIKLEDECSCKIVLNSNETENFHTQYVYRIILEYSTGDKSINQGMIWIE